MRKLFYITAIASLLVTFAICVFIAMSQAPIIVKILAMLCFVEIIIDTHGSIKVREEAMNRDQEKIEHKEAINEMFN